MIANLIELGIEAKYAKILYGNEDARQAIADLKDDKSVDLNKLAGLLVNKKIDTKGNTKEAYLKATQVGNTNTDELKAVVEKIIAANPGVVAEYKKGKTGVAGFFVGQAMKETKGQADPRTLNQLVSDLLK